MTTPPRISPPASSAPPPPTSSGSSPAASSAARRALLERRLRRRVATTVTPRPEGTAPPLSYQQERVWFMEQFAPGTGQYNIPIPMRLTGPLDVELLDRALQSLPARHEALRMRFPADGDGSPSVVVEPAVTVPLRVTEAGGEDEARALVTEFADEPFDLAQGPLLRALLVRIADGDHLLLVSTHHIVGDGWSVDLLLRDLAAAYHGLRSDTGTVLPEQPISYGDFAHWQRTTQAGAELERQLAFWSERLAGVPALELPGDRPRPAVQVFDGDRHLVETDAELTAALNRFSRERGATLFMTLLAAYQVLLARHSGQDDFAVGSSSAGRSLPELENVVGMFVNMLPMRARLGDDPTFEELLERTKVNVLDAFDHAEVPFEKLVNALGVPRDVSRPPVFQAMFALQNYRMGRIDEAGRSDLDITWLPTDLRTTRFDIELHVIEVSDRLVVKFIYNTALFDEATVRRLTARFVALLRSIVADPAMRASELPMLDAEERALLLEVWNDTAVGWDASGGGKPTGGETAGAEATGGEATLHGLVEEQAARTPDAVAVTFEGRHLTYRELDERAGRVAHRLRGLGVGPETLVGVYAERSAELVVALLGVLKAGAAYLPLDPEYPADRLAFMISDAGAPVVLTQGRLRATLPATDATVLDLDDPGEWREGPGEGREDPGAAPGNAAYVIYTSGSTGRPKGVPNTHRGIVNRLRWMQSAYRLGAGDVVLQKTPAGFDVSVWEFFWPLLTGARLVLARPGGHKDAAYLRDLVIAEGVTTAHFVPSMLAVFLADDEEAAARCVTLRRVICSGEELPVATAAAFVAALPGCELHNLYGPTEAAIDVTSWHCSPEAVARAVTLPIGAPIANIRLYVLDRRGNPAPIGVPGELHIGGVGVARGYHRRPALTAERFVPDPFGPEPGGRLYRTGDLARWRHDGNLEFLGRIDHQVKLRGLRIELGEIETALRERPEVAEAVVVVREDTPGDKRLVAYLTAAGRDTERDADEDIDAAELRAALKRTLPDYMVPAAFVTLEALPLSPNGKLDRAALPAPRARREASAEPVEPTTGTEHMLAAIWAEVLGVERIGVHDDFFDAGGHSLLATQVVARIRKASDGSGRPVGVMDLFQNRTIAELAAFIDGGEGAADGPPPLLYELTPKGRPRTLSLVCVPYGGGSAIVYQPLADALPEGNALYSVAIPGHDVGLSEEALPFHELVERLAAEILQGVDGPLVLYGHCGVGSAITVGVARRLAEQGRDVEAVYIGAMFPFARLKGVVGSWQTRLEKLRHNRQYANWLKGMGVDTDDLDPEQADRIIGNMRADSRAAEEYFTTLLDRRADPIPAPIISVVGSEDPVTDYYAERYREWEFITGTTGLVVLDRAGHFFLKHRAEELAEIVTSVHPAMARRETDEYDIAHRGTDAPWALHSVHHPGDPAAPADKPAVQPSTARFAAVTIGQLVSSIGSALTGFAIPVWLFDRTGSVADLGLLWALALVFGVVTLPFAGPLIDRFDRRAVLIVASGASGVIQLGLTLLLWTGGLDLAAVYVMLPLNSMAGTFQRLAFQAAVPQLVPKRYLGHAAGLAQLGNGFAMLFAPLAGAGLYVAIGLPGILAIDVVSYLFAVAVLLVVRFPDLMGWRPREPLLTAIGEGMRYSWNLRGFRYMIIYFGVANIFLAPALVLTVPLTLSFGTVENIAHVAMAEALGATAGGIAMALWGGPRRRRMVGVLLGNLGTAAGCLIMGLRPSLAVVAFGAFWLGAAMSVSQGIYVTLVQVKVPQRFHGRVLALNQAISWSTLPIGFALLAPLATSLFDPLLRPDGALADSVGAVLGTGDGRGVGLTYVVFALVMAATTVCAFGVRLLRDFDTEVPDSLPDDLVGIQERQRRLERLRNDPAAPADHRPIKEIR
ncbi:amino acid adenylation domain-containing protein [Planomonospora sp. ID67723]|uniref:non-ribosomal peptide synthetase/MFS transporter n=1 Tax=Planomonospora sp. ID67723 TaxID=2738134 RepID=UPI0018C40120|nr:non-ribosomal peptide synthetase/MFS transporter [Planomonospora sp. ID67723]MBG0832464.1 amino acid adenylation domain-containing protein [Planomonospora sp. ID67723]